MGDSLSYLDNLLTEYNLKSKENISLNFLLWLNNDWTNSTINSKALLWLSPLLLASLHWSSSSKEMGLTMSSSELKLMQNPKRDHWMETLYYDLLKLSLYHMVNNKQLMYTAPTVRWTLLFSGAPNDRFLSNALRCCFRLSGVLLKLCRLILACIKILLSVRIF